MKAPRAASILWRLIFSALLSLEIVYTVFGSIAGNICSSAGFDFHTGFISPMILFGAGWLTGYPAWLILTLIVLPFSPKGLGVKSVGALVITPVLIYVVLGGGLYLSLRGSYHNGCSI